MTVEELYGKVMADEELKQNSIAAVKDGKVYEWAKDQGVEGTREELIAYAKAALKDNGTVLSDEEISQVAGGRNGFVDGLNRYLGIDDEDVI